VASDQPQSPRATLAQGRTRKPRPGLVGRRTRPCDMVCAPFRAGGTIRGLYAPQPAPKKEPTPEYGTYPDGLSTKRRPERRQQHL